MSSNFKSILQNGNRILELMVTPTNLAYQVKLGHVLNHSNHMEWTVITSIQDKSLAVKALFSWFSHYFFKGGMKKKIILNGFFATYLHSVSWT